MAVPAAAFDADYTLEDKYTRAEGRIYLSGVQALVRLPIMQQMRDRAAGVNTGGFISGYRGSPLGGFDPGGFPLCSQGSQRAHPCPPLERPRPPGAVPGGGQFARREVGPAAYPAPALTRI